MIPLQQWIYVLSLKNAKTQHGAFKYNQDFTTKWSQQQLFYLLSWWSHGRKQQKYGLHITKQTTKKCALECMWLFSAVPPSGCTAEIAELDPTFSSSASFWQSPPWSRSPWNNTLYPLKWMRRAAFFFHKAKTVNAALRTHTHTLLLNSDLVKQSKRTTQTNQINNFLHQLMHLCIRSHKKNEFEQVLLLHT